MPGTEQSLSKFWLLSARAENGEAFLECHLALPPQTSVHASLCLGKSSRNLADRNPLAQATAGADTKMSRSDHSPAQKPAVAPISL